jgi:hypothetical protein
MTKMARYLRAVVAQHLEQHRGVGGVEQGEGRHLFYD